MEGIEEEIFLYLIPKWAPEVQSWSVTYSRTHREPELYPKSCAYLCVWRCSTAPVNPEGQCPHCPCRQWLRRNISSLGAGLWQEIYCCRPSPCLWTTVSTEITLQDTIIHLLVVFCIWAVVRVMVSGTPSASCRLLGGQGKLRINEPFKH